MEKQCIYTSYFANLRNIPKDIIPVSICLYPPKWYTGLEYKKLAPTHSILESWKRDHDITDYTHRFDSLILTRLNIEDVIYDLNLMADYSVDNDIALICYEKPGDFCHRHLVANWLIENGYTATEFKKGE